MVALTTRPPPSTWATDLCSTTISIASKASFLQRALQQAKGNKAKAARLLGIENYQTLAARLKRLGVAENDKSME